ncbi:MAG: hypothetical protein QXW00_02825 [Candidatus Woesearchaeota archaeon]
MKKEVEGKASLNAIKKSVIQFIKNFGADNPERIFQEMLESKINEGKGLVILNEEIFIAPEDLVSFATLLRDVLYLGVRVGSFKNDRFRCAYPFLNELSIFKDELNYVVLNDKAAWLFLCGRDVMRRGIVKMHTSSKTAQLYLIFNSTLECLGYGRIADNAKKDVIIINNFDLGDFLRRERVKK